MSFAECFLHTRRLDVQPTRADFEQDSTSSIPLTSLFEIDTTDDKDEVSFGPVVNQDDTAEWILQAAQKTHTVEGPT